MGDQRSTCSSSSRIEHIKASLPDAAGKPAAGAAAGGGMTGDENAAAAAVSVNGRHPLHTEPKAASPAILRMSDQQGSTQRYQGINGSQSHKQQQQQQWGVQIGRGGHEKRSLGLGLGAAAAADSEEEDDVKPGVSGRDRGRDAGRLGRVGPLSPKFLSNNISFGSSSEEDDSGDEKEAAAAASTDIARAGGPGDWWKRDPFSWLLNGDQGAHCAESQGKAAAAVAAAGVESSKGISSGSSRARRKSSRIGTGVDNPFRQATHKVDLSIGKELVKGVREAAWAAVWTSLSGPAKYQEQGRSRGLWINLSQG